MTKTISKQNSAIQPKNFSLAFEQMCNVVAIADATNPQTTLQKLIHQSIVVEHNKTFSTIADFQETLSVVFGIEVNSGQLENAIEKLSLSGELTYSNHRYVIPMEIFGLLTEEVEKVKTLEATVFDNWIRQITSSYPHLDSGSVKKALKSFLARVFRRHGMRTVRLLDPNFENSAEQEQSISALISDSAKENFQVDYIEDCKKAISSFLSNIQYDSNKVKYITQLADTAFNYFSLAIPPEVSAAFRSRLEGLILLFDTNVLFGLLELDLTRKENADHIVRGITHNHLPFRLRYHAATLTELKESIEIQSRELKNLNYSQHLSKGAIDANVLSGLPLRYHQTNAQSPISVSDFLHRFEHLDILLKEKNLDVYNPSNVPNEFTKKIEYEYQAYLDNLKIDKSLEKINHDAQLLASAHHVRNSQQSSLAIGALLLTLDGNLYRFDQQLSSDLRMKSITVKPEAFLQILRPYLSSKADYDIAFAKAFEIPEFRVIPGKASEAANKLVSVMSGYEGLSEEVASKILSNRILLDQIGQFGSDDEIIIAFEDALGHEVSALAKENSELRSEREIDKHTIKKLSQVQAKNEYEERIRSQELQKLLEQKQKDEEHYTNEVKQLKLKSKEKEQEYQKRFEFFENSNRKLSERIAHKEAKDKKINALIIKSLYAFFTFIGLAFVIWLFHFSKVTRIRNHHNIWTLEISSVIAIMCLGASAIVKAIRQFLWTVIIISFVVVFVEALGGPSNVSPNEPKQEINSPSLNPEPNQP